MMRKAVALLLLLALLIPPHVTQEDQKLYVIGELPNAFSSYLEGKNATFANVSTIEDVPDEAFSLIISPIDRNKTLYDAAMKKASKGILVIILVDNEHDYSKRLEEFHVIDTYYVNETVEISKLPLSARSIGVSKVYAYGVNFNVTYYEDEVLIPGRYNGEQENSTAFALYKKEGSGRIALVSEGIFNTSNDELFEAIYRTLFRIAYPYVESVDVPSIAVAPPGAPFLIKIVNASTFDLEPYYKEENDISLSIDVYRYTNHSKITTLVPTYDSYKKAYFFPATDFGGKRGVFYYNISVKRSNEEIYTYSGFLQLASDEGLVIAYIGLNSSYIETLRENNIVAYQMNSTEDLSKYLADTLLLGENASLDKIRDRYSSGHSFIGIAGNRSEELGVSIGSERSYENITITRRLNASIEINITSARYIEVSNRYSVPLVVGDTYTLVAMIENSNGGKAIVISDQRLIGIENNSALLLALIDKASERHRLNVSYIVAYENDTRLFVFSVKDENGEPINATFIYVENATIEQVSTGVYRVYPIGDFFIAFYEPGYGYKAFNITLSGNIGQAPGEEPNESSRGFSNTASVGFRTFIAFLILLALIASVLYTFKKR